MTSGTLPPSWDTYPITHGYTTTYQGPGTDTPHFADDIGTPFHTELTAPTGGTVKVADYQAWGGEVFVQPDNPGLPEWYMYHLDKVNVTPGEHLIAGQSLGLSGGETTQQVAQGLYPGALHPVDDSQTVWSTGPHTHVGWFQSWYTVPQDGMTVPYGPDPSQLLLDAQSSWQGPSQTPVGPNGPTTGNPGGSSSTPCAWYDVGCHLSQLQSSAQNYINTNTGPFLARLGIGLAGLALIIIGTEQIANDLSGGKVNEAVVSGAKVAMA